MHPTLPGTQSDWFGYRRFDFPLDGRDCLVVCPHEEAEGRPWLWRARFFGHEPQTDLAMLERGFHLVYMDVAELFGAPCAVAHWNAFYAYLTTEHGFAPKAVLEGYSRGGLIVYNWASQNPDKVACIYADAPVCDIKSWPGNTPGGPGYELWPHMKDAYGFASDDDALAWTGNPIDGLAPLAKAGVPLLHVCGDADEVVPMKDNTDVLAARYRALGGTIEQITKPGCKHHPHSLEDPAPIVDFIMRHTC